MHTGNFLHDFRSILLSHLVIVLQTKTKFSEELIFRIIFTHLHISIVMFAINIASGSEANMTTLCEMDFLNFKWLI